MPPPAYMSRRPCHGAPGKRATSSCMTKYEDFGGGHAHLLLFNITQANYAFSTKCASDFCVQESTCYRRNCERFHCAVSGYSQMMNSLHFSGIGFLLREIGWGISRRRPWYRGIIRCGCSSPALGLHRTGGAMVTNSGCRRPSSFPPRV